MVNNPLGDVSLDDLFASARHETEKYNQDLRAKAKQKEELTVGSMFLIKKPTYFQSSTSISPLSENFIGGSSSTYQGGHVYSVELLVTPIQFNGPVEKLLFNGWPPLEAGDTICAYILKGQKEYEKAFMVDFHHDPPFHLVERPYQSVEQPSKIEKLRDGKVVATYHNS